MSEETKVCSKCGERKPINLFVPDKRNKNGIAGDCRDCRSARMREWRKSNRAHLRQYAHKENVLANNRRWKQRNKKQVSEYRIKWYLDNREHAISYASKYLTTHPERADKQRDRMKANSDSLNDVYIRKILSDSGVKLEEVPVELIELKREQLRIYRITKKLKKEILNV